MNDHFSTDAASAKSILIWCWEIFKLSPQNMLCAASICPSFVLILFSFIKLFHGNVFPGDNIAIDIRAIGIAGEETK